MKRDANVDALRNLGFSAISTVIAELATLPICTVKTQYQNTSGASVGATISRLYNSHGISAFYKASVPAILSQTFSTSSKYVVFRYLQAKEVKFVQDPSMSFVNKMLQGVIAGVTSSLMTHPIDAVKIHWQMRKPFVPVLKTEGPHVLYRGYRRTLGKIVVSSAMFFPMYESFLTNTEKSNLSLPVRSVLSSAASASIATIVMQPLDYRKTRELYGLDTKIPLWQSGKALYKGMGLNLARVVPHFVITMTLIELLKLKFN